MIKYIFTVRNHIKSEPRISCERYYVDKLSFKQLCSLDFLLAIEKDKDKKANKNLVKILQEQKKKLCNGMLLSKEQYFSNDSIYFKCIDKFVESKEGWYNCKKD